MIKKSDFIDFYFNFRKNVVFGVVDKIKLKELEGKESELSFSIGDVKKLETYENELCVDREEELKSLEGYEK